MEKNIGGVQPREHSELSA